MVLLAAEASRSTHGRTAAAMETAVTGRAQNMLEFQGEGLLRGGGV